jgi:hypothetical protein
LGYTTKLDEKFDVKIFAGAIYNSNKMNFYVQVYDNDGAFTVFNSSQSIIVALDDTNFTLTINNMISENPNFESNVILNEGSFLASIQEIQRISSLLNYQSQSDKLGLILHGNAPIFPQTFGPLSNYSGVIPVKKKFLSQTFPFLKHFWK